MNPRQGSRTKSSRMSIAGPFAARLSQYQQNPINCPSYVDRGKQGRDYCFLERDADTLPSQKDYDMCQSQFISQLEQDHLGENAVAKWKRSAGKSKNWKDYTVYKPSQRGFGATGDGCTFSYCQCQYRLIHFGIPRPIDSKSC